MWNECVSKAIRASVDWVQVREKDIPGAPLLRLTRAACGTATEVGRGQKIFVNDRLDVACTAGASGVHLGSESLPIEQVVAWRRQVPEPFQRFLIGASCHAVDDVRRAEVAGTDYVFFGPVFDTPSKRAFGEPQGLTRLAEVCRATALPVVAIGGINEQNATNCLTVGAAGIAAIRLFQEGRTLDALSEFVGRIHTFVR